MKPKHIIKLSPIAKSIAIACMLSNDAKDYSEQIADAMERIQTLTNRNEQIADMDDTTDEIDNEFDTNNSEIESLMNRVRRWEGLQNANSFMHEVKPAKSKPNELGNSGKRSSRIESPRDRGTMGFQNFGEFAQSVYMAGRPSNARIDPRLQYESVQYRLDNAPTTYGSTQVGGDGGFLVPDDFRSQIWEQVQAEDDLMSMCDEWPTEANTIKVPKDETTPWGDTGIQVYWTEEAGQITQSKPSLLMGENNLKKLAALVPVTDELIQDATSLNTYLGRKAPQKISFAVDLAIIRGSGAGQPLGFVNAGATIAVAKESGQAADTVVKLNIDKMYNRMFGPFRQGAIWLANQDIEPQLELLHGVVPNAAASDYVGGWPVYLPPGGIADAPYGRLKGRPVRFHQGMSTLGDLGDIAFVNLAYYWLARKAAGVQTDISMHLWFDYAVQAFRVIFRVGGRPWASAPISPKYGSNTYSAFVTLAERA